MSLSFTLNLPRNTITQISELKKKIKIKNFVKRRRNPRDLQNITTSNFIFLTVDDDIWYSENYI